MPKQDLSFEIANYCRLISTIGTWKTPSQLIRIYKNIPKNLYIIVVFDKIKMIILNYIKLDVEQYLDFKKSFFGKTSDSNNQILISLISKYVDEFSVNNVKKNDKLSSSQVHRVQNLKKKQNKSLIT